VLELFYQTESLPRSSLRQRSVGCDGWTDQRLRLSSYTEMVPCSVSDVSSDPKASPSAMPRRQQRQEKGWEKHTHITPLTRLRMPNKQTSGPPSQARGRTAT
jgi:hypothetical protein